MEKTSEAILSLRPVTFHYKSDAKGTPQFGLIAEEVAKVNPALVLPDKEGKPYTVRYEAVNAMLLNEFLKEHRKNEEQQKQINVLTGQLEEQAAQIQKVSAQLATANGVAGMRRDIDGSSRQADISGSELVNPSGGLEAKNGVPQVALNNQ